MPIISTNRDMYSELVKGTSKIEEELAISYHFGLAPVEATTGTLDVQTVGTPVVWLAASSAYVPYDSQDLAAAATAGSTFEYGPRVGMLVGGALGKDLVGGVAVTTTLTTTSQNMTMLFRGPAAINASAITWQAGSDAGEQAAFLKLLNEQGVVTVVDAAVVSPSLTA